MKKGIILALIACTMLFASCGWSTEDKTAVDSSDSPFVSISSDIVYGKKVSESNRIFVYDKYTKIVYYLFSNYNYDPFVEGDHTYTYFTEYINENGNNCVYDSDTNTVVEIDHNMICEY